MSCFTESGNLQTTMSVAGSTDSDPVQWSTSQVMEWMTNFTDSKEAIKQKILSIVRDNDLDGLALKQLRDDSEELHELLPVLKERLTFKAMMKKLLGSPFVRNCKMTVFKVWNSHRTTKKCVAGSCLKDVIEKGHVKLQLKGDLTAVLEEDGTEIDEDDILIKFSGATLILLEENETWKPVEKDWHIHHPALEAGTDVPFTTESSSITPPSVGGLSTAAVPNTLGTSFTDAHIDLQENSSCPSLNTSRASRSVRDIALPTFSLLVQRHLDEGTPHLVWDQLVGEAANFYRATTSIHSSVEYQAIGSKMFAAYPSIGMDGTKPWSLFTSNLSQRIRHMRWLGKKKSQSAANHPSPSAGAAASTPKRRCSGVDVVCLPADEFSIHMKEVWQEWAKPVMNRNEGHIKNLLKETFQTRQKFIKSLPDGVITPAMKSMPYLEEGKYLLYDFCLLLGPEAFAGLKKSVATLIEAVESLTGEKEEGAGRMLKCILHIEKKTCFERGKKRSSIIVQKEDIPDEDVQTELQTAPHTAPHIAVLRSSGQPSGVTKQTVVSSVPLISQSSQPFKASVAPQSPTQSPSTSLESPPPPTLTRQQAPPLPPVASPTKNVFIGDQHPTAVLPAFSSFVSSRGVPSTSSPLIASAHGCTSTQFETSGNGHRSGQDENYHAIYPTGIISDAYSKRIPTTQTPIYQGQVTVSSPTSNPSSSYDLTFTYSDPRIQTSASSQASSLSDQSCTTEMAPASSRSNNMKLKMGHWASSRGMRYTKAHEITQKYKKILQRVRLTAESDREQIHFPAPLPTFSPILQQQIDRGNILSFKTRFVYECAQFYMSINPTPTHTAYRNISMTIVAKFPELADHSNDREPWRPFNTSLSQAIRNIRRRLRSVPGTGFPPAAPRYQHIQGRDVSNMTGNMSGMNMHHANNDLPHPKAMNRHQRGSPSTSDISESINDSDDPIECVEIPEEPSNRRDNESGEVQDVVIKTEDLPDNEEEIIPVEWSNDDNN